METSPREKKSGENKMEENWNRAAEPAHFGQKDHR